MKRIVDIKNEFKHASTSQLKRLLLEYSQDTRAGVKKILDIYHKKLDNHYKELNRLKEISKFENYYFESGLRFVGGMDEVGRGPLAGPVVACCVVLKKGIYINGVSDSKKLSEKRRNEIFWDIENKALDIGLGSVDEKTIDRINISQAVKLAMTEAYNNLSIKPDVLLIDYVRLDNIHCVQESIVKGDQLSLSIGAASIMAKVMRDEMMYNYAKEYPQYHFENNKGYGSKEHFQAIEKYGLCPIHRKSFLKDYI